MEAWHTVYTELARPPPLFVCFDSFGMFLKLENRVLSLHSSEEDVGSCGILLPGAWNMDPAGLLFGWAPGEGRNLLDCISVTQARRLALVPPLRPHPGDLVLRWAGKAGSQNFQGP